LVAGPIERANHLLPQVQTKRTFNYTQAVEGCRLILWGMFKKVVIADSLGDLVDPAFNNFQSFNAYSLILSTIGFSFQIYGDFSGYTDIALGTSKLLGFELLSNFKFPYFSRDIAEFWRRWHVSLSSWFRDYLYIPLGGSKQGKRIAVRNIFIIFLVSGFWHGASLNFIAWGAIHACGFLPLLLLNRNRRHTTSIVAVDRKLPNLKELKQMIYTFGFVTFAWIFFRIHSLKNGIRFVKQIVIDSYHHPTQYLHKPQGAKILLYASLFILFDWWLRRDERSLRNFGWVINIILALLIWWFFKTGSSFIYFQF
jgi:D-alanyl-lipoteichoic acid acyltransferase DltB (MBOAT superfamily)